MQTHLLPYRRPAGFAHQYWVDLPRPFLKAPPSQDQAGYEPVRALLEKAASDGVFPGASFGVLRRGKVEALSAVGRFTYAPESLAVTAATSFDLASVSKVVATTAMAMLLWQRGQLELETLLADLLPAFVVGPDGRRRCKVTIKMLLAHSSGLPAYAPLYQSRGTAGELLRAALRLELEHEPGSCSAYSDPGFILLGKALELVAGEPLDRYCRREIFEPLGMAWTRYRPAPGDREAIPPTEEDRCYRHRTVQGEVHDENCFALGGVAGHAGLFAPGLDLLRFAEAMLAPLRANAGDTLFRAQTVRLFTRRAEMPAGSSRALGWDTPSGSPSSAGAYIPAAGFGHLGYTGTSLWIDPLRDAAVVLLSNRTFPTRENRKIQELRPRFHDAVFQSTETGTKA